MKTENMWQVVFAIDANRLLQQTMKCLRERYPAWTQLFIFMKYNITQEKQAVVLQRSTCHVFSELASCLVLI